MTTPDAAPMSNEQAVIAASEEAYRLALRRIAHWPFDVNKTAEEELRTIKNYAAHVLGEVAQ